MNANCHKVIFSKRVGTLVAVGEHTTSSGKAASGQTSYSVVFPASFGGAMANGFIGVLRFSFASVVMACLSLSSTQAQSVLPHVAANALPQGGSVSIGSATISTQGAAMAITQSTNKASINWQSFNIGSAASVNIAQPSSSAVLLNRVVGNDPSQILGKLSANGQVILLNPNGVLFGKDGSVTASAFTASTFGLTDADFMAGFYKFNRNGSTAAVVNQGTIETSAGGFVALIGATVTNEGRIIAPQGDVVLAAAESVTLPTELVNPSAQTTPNTVSVRMSKRVRLELAPAAINTAVNNTESGVIVTEGGQVLLQAAALSSAVASVTHSGRIDTSAPQAGAVTVLADNGDIQVNGSIRANSSNSVGKGGDIIIGRDIDTGVLAKTADVSGAALESQGGFVETSGEYLNSSGVKVKSAEWLLDPNNIEINLTNVAVTAGNSVVLAGDIATALTAGTTVTIATGTGAGSTSSAVGVGQATAGTGNTSAGTIAVNSAITSNYTGATNPVLTLSAASNINVSAAITATGSDIVLKSTGGAISNTAAISGRNVSIDNTGGTIDPTTGAISQPNNVGTTGADGITVGANITASGNLNMYGRSTSDVGIRIASGKTLTGGNIQAVGETGSVYGLNVGTGASIVTTATSGSNLITAIGTSSGGGGSGALALVNATLRAASGSTLELKGQAVGLAPGAPGNTRGMRIDGVVDTYGAITLTGESGSTEGVLLQAGNINVREGSLTINGTMTANGGGWRNGVTLSRPIYLYNNTSLSVEGKAANLSAAMDVGKAEKGVNIGAVIESAAGQTGGDVTIIGYTSSVQNSIGADISGNISTGGNVKIIGQTLGNSTGNSVSLNSVINSTSGNVTIQSIGGKINQVAAKTISARNITIDNTGAGLSSLIADTTAGLNLSVGTSMGGSINNATGAITAGSGKAESANGVTIAASLTASNNLNLYGTSGSANGIVSSAAMSGAYINAIGKSLTGSTGYAWNSGNISTTGTGGLSTASTVTGISDASVFTSTSGYGAFNMYASAGVTAFSGTSLSLVGNATTIAAGATTNVRGWRINGGSTLTTNGDINITGTSNNDDGLWIGGSITRTGAVSQLTLSGTTASSVNAGLSGVYLASGSINGAAATGGISITGTATNTSGASTDNAVRVDGTVTGGSASAVNIQGSSGNVVTGAAISANSISLSSNDGSVSSSAAGTLAGGASGVSISSATAGTLAGVISGTGPLTKTGAGTTTLTASNTYTGTTTISAGTLQVGNGGATGTLGSSSVVNNAALIFNRDASADLTVASAISGSGTLTQAGLGKTILTANNSYTGTTTISAGTLQIGNDTTTGTLGTGAVTNNALLDFKRSANTNVTNTITGSGDMQATLSAGGLRLLGNVTLGGDVDLTAEHATDWIGVQFLSNVSAGGGINISGGSSTRHGVQVDAFKTLKTTSLGAQSVTITGSTSSASAAGIAVIGEIQTNNGSTLLATGTATNGGNGIYTELTTGGTNYGKLGSATSGDITLVGTSSGGTAPTSINSDAALNRGHGMVLRGGITTQGHISLTGEADNGVGVFLQHSTYDYGRTMAEIQPTLQVLSGGANMAGQDAIFISGTNFGSNAFNNNGVLIGSKLINNSNGGATTITSPEGGIALVTSTTGTSTGSGSITNAATAGAISLTAGDGTATSSASIGSLPASIGTGNNVSRAWTLSPAGTQITQNSNAGVTMTSDGTGNVTPSKITNNGTGDVVIGAGTQLNAGDGSGGQVLTVSGNTVTQKYTGKTYVYTGAAASTGALSNLSSSFNTLYFTGTAPAAFNSAFNTAFGSTIASGQNTQVLFRDSAGPSFVANLPNITKTYGEADPANLNTALQTAYTNSGGGAYLTQAVNGAAGSSNTFAIKASELIADVNITRTAGEAVGNYALNMVGTTMNANITGSTALSIGKRDITLAGITASNKTYDGSNAATVTAGTFNNLKAGETLLISGTGSFADANVGNGKTVTANIANLNKTDGLGSWSNYNLTSTGNANSSANITPAALTITVNGSSAYVTQDPNSAFNQGFSYSGFVNGETAASALSAPPTRAYEGGPNPSVGNYVNAYGIGNVVSAKNGNYTITVNKGALNVIAADALLFNVASQSSVYGSITAANADTPAANSVTAQYCLVPGDCNGSNIVNLSLRKDTAVPNQWVMNDSTSSTVQFTTALQNTSYSSGGYLQVGNYDYSLTSGSPVVIGTQNFNTVVSNTGILSVTPLAVSLQNTPISKAYDGTTSLPNTTLSISNLPTGDDLQASFTAGAFQSSAVSTAAPFSLYGVALAGTDSSNYTLQNYANNTYSSTGVIMGTSSKPQPIVHPPKPIIPTDSNSGGGESGGDSSSGNPYLLIPSGRPNSADRCTPNTLEDCLCETQEPRPVEGIAICYQPKKTASTTPAKGRRG